MNAVLVTLAKVDGKADTTQRIFDPTKMIDLKETGTGALTALEFSYPDKPSNEVTHYVTGPMTMRTLLERTNNASPSGHVAFVGRINTTSGFGIGVHDVLDLTGNPIVLPKGTRLWEGYYEVITTFTSSTDAATISLDIATDDVAGLKAATAISTGTTWDATGAPVAVIPLGTIATVSEKTTDKRKLQYTVAVEALTAGDMIVFFQGFTGL